MADWLMRVIRSEAKQLISLAAEDEDLRAELRALAQEILAATEESQVGTISASLRSGSSGTTRSADDEGEKASGGDDEPLRELTLGKPAAAGGGSVAAPLIGSSGYGACDELSALESNCRQKAEAARWAVERLLEGREGSSQCEPLELFPVNVTAYGEKLVDWYYWSQASRSSDERDFALLEDAAGCFESLAEGVAIARTVLEKHQGAKAFERILPLLAEAQSALRVALKRLSAPDTEEQLEVFEFVRATASRHRIYLKRFMRADDAADPANWPNLLARIEATATSGQLNRQQAAEMERIKELATHIEAGAGSDQDWQTIIQMVDELVAYGIPPSNAEIRNALLGVIDALPEQRELPDGFRRVLCEIDRYVSRRPTRARVAVEHATTPDVTEARRLLQGRAIVLIGGARRREAQESLRRAFGLCELIWIETKEHQSIDSFEPLIARGDVAVVLLAIRWSSHAFGDVRQFCDRHDKPLARLPGGYSPNQVAVQIVAQCSGKLDRMGHAP